MKLALENLAPRLRFNEFNGSWEFPLLDSVTIRGSGHTPSKDYPEYYNGEIDWISLADSKSLDSGYISKTKSRISELGLANSSAVLHPPETVILSRDAGVGKSAVMKHSMAVSQHFIAWRPIDGTSSSWFIYYWLQIQKREFERIAIGSTIKTIGLPYFKKLKIPLPTLPEQQKIANFLTAVDARIGHLVQKRALLTNYKKGVMQQLFTQAIRFKDDHGKEFPDWEEKKLGEVVEINPKSTDLPESFIYIDLESVNDGRLHSPRRIAKSDAPSRAQRLLQKGDILYQTVRPYQMNNYRFGLDDVHVASTGYAQLRASSHNAEFVYQSVHFPAFVGAVLDRCTGTSYPAINSKDLAQIKLGVPSAGEQTKIANFLSAIDLKIESVATQISETQTFKRGLLQQMFV